MTDGQALCAFNFISYRQISIVNVLYNLRTPKVQHVNPRRLAAERALRVDQKGGQLSEKGERSFQQLLTTSSKEVRNWTQSTKREKLLLIAETMTIQSFSYLSITLLKKCNCLVPKLSYNTQLDIFFHLKFLVKDTYSPSDQVHEWLFDERFFNPICRSLCSRAALAL